MHGDLFDGTGRVALVVDALVRADVYAQVRVRDGAVSVGPAQSTNGGYMTRHGSLVDFSDKAAFPRLPFFWGAG